MNIGVPSNVRISLSWDKASPALSNYCALWMNRNARFVVTTTTHYNRRDYTKDDLFPESGVYCTRARCLAPEAIGSALPVVSL